MKPGAAAGGRQAAAVAASREDQLSKVVVARAVQAFRILVFVQVAHEESSQIENITLKFVFILLF